MAPLLGAQLSLCFILSLLGSRILSLQCFVLHCMILLYQIWVDCQAFSLNSFSLRINDLAFSFEFGTRGRTRTGTAFAERFSYHYSFRYLFSLWSGLYLHHSLRLRCPPSSLYTFKIAIAIKLRSVLAF